MQELRLFKKVLESDLETVAFEVSEFMERPSVIFLSGAVGAGKTTFVQKFLEAVKGGLRTSSPSYSIVHETGDVLHADLYRLEDEEELVHLELEELLEGKEFAFIEWSDQFEQALSYYIDPCFHRYKLSIEIEDDKRSRSIRFSKL